MHPFLNPRPSIETLENVLFLHRPFVPESKDLETYVEEEISDVLTAEESLADVIYRYWESTQGILIGLARVAAVLEGKPAAGHVFFRVPEPFLAWMKWRKTVLLESDQPALLYFITPSSHYLIHCDTNQLYRISRFLPSKRMNTDLLSIVDHVHAAHPEWRENRFVYSFTPLNKELESGLIDRRFAVTVVDDPGELQVEDMDKELLAQWDFRLDEEVDRQELLLQKFRTLRFGLVALAAVVALWLVLFSSEKFFHWRQDVFARKFQSLRGSIKEISHLRNQNTNLISEILLSRDLMGKRTQQARILEQIVLAKPEVVKLSEVKTGRKHRRSKSAREELSVQQVVTVKGYANAGEPITRYIEGLARAQWFSSAHLVSMEKKKARYHFQIQLGLNGPSL